MPLGIPWSRFMAWPVHDRDLALSWRAEQAEVCRGCGTRPDEWETDPDAYIGDLVLCRGCQRLEEEADNVPAGGKGWQRRLLPRAVARARMDAGEGVP